MVVALPTTPPGCLLRLSSSHLKPGRPLRLLLLHRRSPCPLYTPILHTYPGYHPRGQSLLWKQSRASTICGRRCSSSKTRASQRGFRCCSIRDCQDSSIRVIKRYAAGFSFATIAHRRERLALPNLHLHSPAAQLLQLLRLLNQPLNQT